MASRGPGCWHCADQNKAMTTAEAIAKMHYQRNDWSGCAGSGWDDLTTMTQRQKIAEAQEWLTSMRVAGFIIARPA
jgi:hypothetical protein